MSTTGYIFANDRIVVLGLFKSNIKASLARHKVGLGMVWKMENGHQNKNVMENEGMNVRKTA